MDTSFAYLEHAIKFCREHDVSLGLQFAFHESGLTIQLRTVNEVHEGD